MAEAVRACARTLCQWTLGPAQFNASGFRPAERACLAARNDDKHSAGHSVAPSVAASQQQQSRVGILPDGTRSSRGREAHLPDGGATRAGRHSLRHDDARHARHPLHAHVALVHEALALPRHAMGAVHAVVVAARPPAAPSHPALRPPALMQSGPPEIRTKSRCRSRKLFRGALTGVLPCQTIGANTYHRQQASAWRRYLGIQ